MTGEPRQKYLIKPLRRSLETADQTVRKDEYHKAMADYELTAFHLGEVAIEKADGSFELLYSPSMIEAGSAIFGVHHEGLAMSFMLERNSTQAVAHGLAGHILGATRGLLITSEENYAFTIEQENLTRPPESQLESHHFHKSKEQLEVFGREVIKRFILLRELSGAK